MKDKRRKTKQLLASMRRRRIEAQARIEEVQRRLQEGRAQERRHEQRLQAIIERVRLQPFEAKAIDLERSKRTHFEQRSEMSYPERIKQTLFEARPEALDPERTKLTLTDKIDLAWIKRGARFR